MISIKISNILPICLSIFLHFNGATLVNPDVTLESAIHTILIMIILHRIRMLYTSYSNSLWIQITESYIIFILLQVILMISWEYCEDIANDVFTFTLWKLVDKDTSGMLTKVVNLGGTLTVLCLEYMSLLWLFDLTDFLDLFGAHNIMLDNDFFIQG